MELSISSDSLTQTQQKLELISERAESAIKESGRSRLSEAFSQIPGLGFLAAEHGRTLSGNPGAAAEEFMALRDKISWAADNLHNLASAVYEQDEYLSSSLTHMYSGHPSASSKFFTAAEPSDKSAPVAINSPAIGRVPDINLLASYFSGTVDSAAHHDADLWQQLSQAATEISDGLEEVAADLEANNYGDAISGGAQKLRHFAETSRTLNANSQIMNSTINNLIGTIEAARNNTRAVQAAVALNHTPSARELIEKTYLDIFPTQFSTALQTAVPRLLGLSIPSPAASGGENQAVGTGHAQSGVEEARAAMQLPREVQQTIAEYGPNQATFAAADNGTAQLANVGQNSASTHAAAHHSAATNNTPTNIASQAATFNPTNAQQTGFSVPNHGGAGSPGLSRFEGTPGTMAANNSPNAGAARVLGNGNTGTPLNTGITHPSPTTTNGSQPINASGTNLFGGARGANTSLPGVSESGRGVNNSVTGRGGMNPGAQLGIGARGLGSTAIPGAGGYSGGHSENFSARPISSGGGVSHAGGPNHSGSSGPHAGQNSPNATGNHGSNGHGGSGSSGSNGQHGAHNPHGNSASGNHNSQAGSSSRSGSGHMGRGMMPMMGGAGQQGQGTGTNSKPSRAKAVTTAIEREGNQKALLGERRPVVPGVIGAWVRD